MDGNIKYSIKKKRNFFQLSTEDIKVSVIVPVYNAENNLDKTLNSVLHQSIGIDNLELIMVDDCSTDKSREILLRYTKIHKNIQAVFLKENTGSPAKPRNIGIDLAKGEYITFLDADDWLHSEGLEKLYSVAKENNVDYVVGKTLEITSKGEKIVGEHESCIERRDVSPYTIPHIFQHMGPRARIVKTSLVKENDLNFPDMRFAEDKQFFINVLIHSKSISTTKDVIYYLNRLEENNASLTKKTDIVEKTQTNIEVIKNILKVDLEHSKKALILNRLYEFDCITRLFNRQHFLKSKDKESYYKLFEEVLETTRHLDYDISEYFFHPINKVAFQLLKEKKYDDVVALFKWEKGEKNKKIRIIDDLAYYVSPLKEKAFTLIPIPMLATYLKDEFVEDHYHLELKIYGKYTKELTDILFRNRENVLEEFTYKLSTDDYTYFKISIPLKAMEHLSKSSYQIMVRYLDYRKVNITRNTDIEYEYNNRRYQFYNTINSNLGFKIR